MERRRRHDQGLPFIVMAFPPVGHRAVFLIAVLTLPAAAQLVHSPGTDPRLSLSRLPVAARVDLPRSADWMAFGFGSVWVVNYRPSRVSRIDAATNTMRSEIPLPADGCL